MRTLQLFILAILSSLSLTAQKSITLDSVSGTFGFACGFSARPQPTTLKTIQLVNNSDKTELLKWLNSKNPQTKIHGIIGIYFLERNGVGFSEGEKTLLKKAETSNKKVDYCSGCQFGQKAPISKLITKDWLNSYYQSYEMLRYGNLK